MSVNNVISEDQLPAWMKQAKRGVDWGALLIIGFSVIAAWSFIMQTELPITNDSEAYVYRIADYADAFEQGIFYSRWSPHALSGYGAPIPHYYPSGAAYFGGFISFLFTNNPITAVRILYVFSLIIAGSATYTFVAQRTTSRAGITAALLYIYSPYMMITVSHIEGDLALAIGTALLPSLLWAANRLLKRYQPLDFTLIAIIVAAIIFTVPIILLHGILAILVLLGIEFQYRRHWGKLITLIAAILAGGLLSAFYWLPALMQYNVVQWYPSLYDLPQYSLTLQELFAPSRSLDATLAIQTPQYNLGWGLLFALIISTPMLLFGKADRRLSISFFILGTVLLSLVLLLTPERSSWLVLISFCFAIASSYSGQETARTPHMKRISNLLSGIIILFSLLSTVPLWAIPPPNLPIEDVSPQAQVAFEQAGYGFVGIPYGLPLPSNVSPDFALNSPMADNYDEHVVRFQNIRLLSSVIDESPYVGRYTIASTDATSLTYNRAYFDSWQVITHQGNLPLSTSTDNLILVEIPANIEATSITIKMGLTPLTLSAWVVSTIAFIICLIFWWYRFQQTPIDYDESLLLSRRSASLLFVLLIGLGVVRGVVPSLFPDLSIAPTQNSMASALFVRTNYDRAFQLLAYELSAADFAAGEAIEFTAYWTLERRTTAQYLVRLRLTDNLRRNTFYETSYTHAGHFPTNRWQPSSVISQTFNIVPRENLPVGNYFITFDVIVCTEVCSIEQMNLRQAEGEIRILRPITID